MHRYHRDIVFTIDFDDLTTIRYTISIPEIRKLNDADFVCRSFVSTDALMIIRPNVVDVLNASFIYFWNVCFRPARARVRYQWRYARRPTEIDNGGHEFLVYAAERNIVDHIESYENSPAATMTKAEFHSVTLWTHAAIWKLNEVWWRSQTMTAKQNWIAGNKLV